MQVSLNHVFTETSGAGSDGDCSVHPEHSRRASRSCALYLHQPGSPLSVFSSKPFSVPDKHGSQAARQHELGKQQQARRRFWGQREYQGESFARKMFFLAGEVPEDGPCSRGGANLAQCRIIVDQHLDDSWSIIHKSAKQ